MVLDNAWEGSPRVGKIKAVIASNLVKSGWQQENILEIAIAPELEAWVLQDNPNVAQALRFRQGSLKDWLVQRGLWDAGMKPNDPKKAIEKMLKYTRTPRSSAICKQIASKISVKFCQDRAFCLLRDKLQQWFPVEEG